MASEKRGRFASPADACFRPFLVPFPPHVGFDHLSVSFQPVPSLSSFFDQGRSVSPEHLTAYLAVSFFRRSCYGTTITTFILDFVFSHNEKCFLLLSPSVFISAPLDLQPSSLFLQQFFLFRAPPRD